MNENVAAYITYYLLNLDGAGIQPAHQVAQMGMRFSGGLWKRGEAYFGYLIGDADKVADTLAALSAWGARRLAEAEALAWSEAALLINVEASIMDDGDIQYIGPAEIDVRGYIQRPSSNRRFK